MNFIKTGKVVMGVGFGLYFGNTIYDQNEKLNNCYYTFTRVARSALTVGRIGFDYKKSLLSTNSPIHGSQEYENLKTVVHLR